MGMEEAPDAAPPIERARCREKWDAYSNAQMCCLSSAVAFGDLVMLIVFFSFKQTEMKLPHRGKN